MKEWNRRQFLKNTSAATLAALAAGAPISSFLASCNTHKKITSKADTVILLWMAGGMPHTETFDPKKYTPFEKGMQSNSVLSTFTPVPTALEVFIFQRGLNPLAG